MAESLENISTRASRPVDPERSVIPEKRTRILQAAREVFEESGFDAARVDEVARRARVSKGTVYNHFASKESLLVEAVLSQMAEDREHVKQIAASQADSDHGLVTALRLLITEVLPSTVGRGQSLAYQIWALVARDEEIRARVFEEFRSVYERREHALVDLVAAGTSKGTLRDDVSAEDISLLLLSVFDGLVYRSMFDRDRIAPERSLEGLLRILEGALRNESKPGRSGAALIGENS